MAIVMTMMKMMIYGDDGDDGDDGDNDDDGDVELKCKSDKANSTTRPLFAEHLIFNLKRPPPTL